MFNLLSRSGIKLKPILTECLSCKTIKVYGARRLYSYNAAVLTNFGQPLEIQKISEENRAIAEGQVLIDVSYCSLNAIDVRILQGDYARDKLKLPLIPGYEFSGKILAVGINSKYDFKVDDRVVALKDYLTGSGGLRRQVICNEKDVWIRDGVSSRDAAVLPYGHGTALLAFSKYALNENDVVIVTAGPAGLGLGAIEVAATVFKAKVIAICDTSDTSALIRDEGAFQTISLKDDINKVYKYLEKALDGKKANLGVDAIGNGLLYLLDEFVDRTKGKLLTIDPFYNAATLKDQRLTFNKKTTKTDKETTQTATDDDDLAKRVTHIDLANYRDTDTEYYRQIVAETLSLCNDEIITAYVSGTFRLDEVDKAIEFINKKKCTGKVLIDVRSEEEPPKKEATKKKDSDSDSE